MKLNKDLIMQPNTVVHARTEEEAKILCEWADGEDGVRLHQYRVFLFY